MDIGGAESLGREAAGKLGIFHSATEFLHEPADIEGERQWFDLMSRDEARHFADDTPLVDFSYEEHEAAISDYLDNARTRRSQPTLLDVICFLPHINPGGFKLNCINCAIALDDVLHGVPRVAGPGLSIKLFEFAPVISRRAYRLSGETGYLKSTDFQSFEKVISMEKPGTCGILMRIPLTPEVAKSGHVWNVMTTSSGPMYLDAQVPDWGDSMFGTSGYTFYYFKTGASRL